MAKILLNVELNTAHATQEIQKIKSNIKSLENVKTVNVNSLQKSYATLLSNLQGIKKYYPKGVFTDFEKSLKTNITQLKAFNEKVREGTTLLPKEQQDLEKIAKEYENLATDIKTATVENKNFHGSFKEIVSGFLKFQGAATVVMTAINLVRNAIRFTLETLIEVENKVIEIRRVLREDVSKKKVSSDLLHIAQELGQSFENVSEIATNFARAGLDWNNTLKATRAAVLALNVAELDATQASDGLLSVMTQFGYKAEDLVEIVAKLNQVADRNPVTTEKLLTALQRTGSAAKNARMELDDTIGVITALSKATNRSGQNLGTAANALIQYSTKSSALDIFSRLSSGSAQAVEDYRMGKGSILDIWREVSLVIKSASADQQAMLQELADSPEIEELGQELHDELGDIFEETQEVYGTANTFRKNYFIALLNNMDTVEKAIGDTENATEHLYGENAERMESLTTKVEQLKALFQEIANDQTGILSFVKSLVDAARLITEIGAVVSNWANSDEEGFTGWGKRFLGNLVSGHGLIGSTVLASSKEARDFVQDWKGNAADAIHAYRVGAEAQEDIADETEETAKAARSWEKSLYSVMKNYEDIADSIKSIREDQQKIYDIEEKKKALEDALNNKNVRVYNAATGTWEWQANEKDIKSARENLEDAFFKDIDSKLREGNNTAADILNYIAEYMPLIPDAVETVKKVLERAGYKTDISTTATAPRWTSYEQAAKYLNVQTSAEWSRRNSGKSYQEYLDEEYAKYYGYKPTYDSGGILSGLGGIKATSRPETVLPPDLTEKILTPSSNADFTQFAKSLGIMFGTSREVAKGGIIHNYGGNTDNSDNRSYTVNGIPFSAQDAGSKTLNELFAEAAYFKN